MAEPLSPARRLLYALGGPGFQITDRIIVLVAVYFYLPPPGRGLEAQVPESTYLGFVTVYGVAMLAGRVFDTLADPVVGHLSDRSTSRFGRRRVMLMLGIGPMIAIPALLFFPPFPAGSLWNGAWAAGLLSVYFVAFTAYVAPYYALIPELAWSQPDRLRLSQTMQIVAIPIVGAFTAWGVGLDLGRAAGLSTTTAVRVVAVGGCLLALLLALGPILAVEESRHARGTRSELPFREALLATLRNRPFLLYLLGQIFFVMGVNVLQPVFPYLATVVLGRSEGFTVYFLMSSGVGIGLGFLLQRSLVARFGPKRVLMGCLALGAISVSWLGLLEPAAPGSPRDAVNLALCFSSLGLFGVPAVGFMVLPHILMAQLIDADERRTGAMRSAMFYGVQGLLTKWVYGLATWGFTFLLARFGNSPEAPWGVVVVGPVAGLLCAVAFGIYAFYPERTLIGGRGRVVGRGPKPDEEETR